MSAPSDRVRVLRVDLSAVGEARPAPFRPADAALRRVGELGGSALAAALLDEHFARDAGGPALAVAVGPCVARGLPTAARAAVAARGPLTGALAEGQVGGELAARLAGFADGLIVTGRAPAPGAVLALEAGGAPRLLELPDLDGQAPATVARAIAERLGPCAVLCPGPAGRAGIPFATLAAWSDGHASHVGRGGLGAVPSRLGLLAVAVLAEPVEPARDDDALALVRLLASSPRLRARAEGGTFELAGALRARGDLRGPAGELGRTEERALWEETRRLGRGRHGCRGCPTPCGWTFGRADGERQPARFGASLALGPDLGLGFADALELLARCDELGLDAKEAGAVLALRSRARELGRDADGPRAGEREDLFRALNELAASPGDVARGACGAASLAQLHGLPLAHAGGQSVRPATDLAHSLGQRVSAGGTDPMRSFPFSTQDGLDRARIEELTGLALPEGAEDPRDPRGKGRLVWWHENLAAALDAAGFCAFSAAGLLADGACELDELARLVAPRALLSDPAWGGAAPARALLAAGASTALLRRRLDARLGAAPAGRAGDPDARLAAPGMLDEYGAARGLGADGHPTSDALARLGTAALLELGERALAALDAGAPRREAGSGAPEVASEESRPGRVRLHASGPLALELGSAVELELRLPAPAAAVVAELARRRPAAAGSLQRGGRPLVAVFRAGLRLAPDQPVWAGDELDLVLAVSGG